MRARYERYKMLFRRKKEIPEPELTREEMEELVDEGLKYAGQYAAEGNVSGMEMALEEAMKYGRKIGRSFDPDNIDRIRLQGYELGEKLMRKQAEKYQGAGKLREYQNAMQLADSYGGQAGMLRYGKSKP